jgi:very-short-patch-repair endonuclease
MNSKASLLQPFLRRQDGVVTTAQALDAGLTPRQLTALLERGWSRPARGVYVQPDPRDPFRASLRAALLLCPDAAACGVTAGRLYDAWGLPLWTPAELPELIVPAGSLRAQRSGMHVSFGLDPADRVRRKGFPVTSLARTVADLAGTLPLDDLICLVDRALALGWTPDGNRLSRRKQARLREALRLADGRSESPLETKLRLLLVRAGLPPEALQLRLFTKDGVCFARVDFAWPSCRLVVEADGRDVHSLPEALLEDRVRQNRLMAEGWTVLRFTWHDVTQDDDYVITEVAATRRKLRLAYGLSA